MGELKDLIGFGGFGEGITTDIFVKVGSYLYVVFMFFFIAGAIILAFWFIDLYFFRYKYTLFVKVNRKGGNHYWRFAKGGYFTNRKTKSQEFRIWRWFKFGLALPLPPAEAIEPLEKGKGLIFINQFDTGTYDYLPFVPQQVGKELRQQILPADMQTWVAHKIKEQSEKFRFVDWLAKYQGLVFTGAMLMMLLFGMYFMYKANAYAGDAIRQAASTMAEIARTQTQYVK
jgi:hypothetical protein